VSVEDDGSNAAADDNDLAGGNYQSVGIFHISIRDLSVSKSHPVSDTTTTPTHTQLPHCLAAAALWIASFNVMLLGSNRGGGMCG
jgi:hypothetical protein